MPKSPSRSGYELLEELGALNELIRAKVSAANAPTKLTLSALTVIPFDLDPFEGTQMSLRFSTAPGLEHKIVFTATGPNRGAPVNTPRRREVLASQVSERIVAAHANAAAIEAVRVEILAAADEIMRSCRRTHGQTHIIQIAPQPMIVGEPIEGDPPTFYVEMVGSFRHSTGVTARGHTTIVASDRESFAAEFRRWVSFETQRALEPRFKSAA